MKIFTAGHSTNTKAQFLKVLEAADIDFVADVRAFPYSRKHPQFNGEEMKKWLQEAGVGYDHFPLLGGRRSTASNVGSNLNNGWDNVSFHNYADYTLTEDFHTGIEMLAHKAASYNVVCVCSERHPARCHRLIISNWLAAHDWTVQHIINNSKNEPELVDHILGRWGAMPIIEEDGTVVYPEIV
ncbi:DUF488 family protein [Salinicoccus hispanicus]|uniref:DUF488 family protein n=1 Tax=Salinicoccus hispanicus TaxID=157225 RepID=A0A6N8U3K7_9STAP|nr:DUF488 domain-containing protein [Salinicoccus hispanicus]MXQ51646.1 DUF488 family protein [Salinicoccus hispanicus]